MNIGGQIFGKQFGFQSGGSLGAFTTSWYAVVVSRGGTATDAELANWTTFENNMTASELNELDRLNQFGLSNSIAARTSFVNPSSTAVTAVNSPTFTAYQGYQGNGSTSYLDSNYNVLNDSIKYTLNSASGGVYLLDVISSTKAAMGSFNITQSSTILFPYYSGTPLVYINNAPPDGVSTGNSQGFNFIVRQNSSTIKHYTANSLKATLTRTSTAIPNLNIYYCGFNSSGILSGAYNGRISLVFMGSGNINQSNFYNAVQTLGTSQGWAV